MQDRKGICTVFLYPRACRDARLNEEENAVVDLSAVKAKLCRDHRKPIGVFIDGPERNGAELRSVFSVEDDAVDRVRIHRRPDAVQNDVSDGDLPEKRLTAAFQET